MNPFLLIMAAFIAIPIAEIYVLIEVGGMLGVWNTIAFVIFTAVVGAALVRSQGMATLGRIQQGLQSGAPPGALLIEGALILFAGALLLTPGFITDAVGFICLLPPTRTWMAAQIARRAVVHVAAAAQAHAGHGANGHPGRYPGGRTGQSGPGQSTPNPGVIDGEYTREPPPEEC